MKRIADAEVMSRMLGLPCWYVAAGGCTGSVFQLYLGKKIPRNKPVANDMLADEARVNKGEYGFMATCPWRLDAPDGPITGWLEPCENDGPMVSGLNNMVGQNVRHVRILEPSWDIEFGFTGDLTLKVFCDATKAVDRSWNWYLFGPNGLWVASEKEGLVINPF